LQQADQEREAILFVMTPSLACRASARSTAAPLQCVAIELIHLMRFSQTLS
jgi:hypothetical protein